MSHAIAILLAIALSAIAEDPAVLLERLQAATASGDWKPARTLSAELRAETATRRDQSLAGSNAKFVDDVMGWLPLDTETVLVAQQPFAIEASDSQAVPTLLDRARGYALELIVDTEDQRLYKALGGRTVRSAVMAGRRFQEHESDDQGIIPFGMIAWQGCGFYSLAVDPTVFTQSPSERVLGEDVWISHGIPYAPSRNAKTIPDTFFSLLPRANLLVICNDRDFLTTVLSRMPGGSTGPSALPADLPEWKQLDRTQQFWALRHYRRDRADVDPTDPRNELLGTEHIEATGLIVEFDQTSARARMLVASGGNPWKEIATADEFHGSANVKELSSGVWELSVAGGVEAQSMAVFVLMAVLGFEFNI